MEQYISCNWTGPLTESVNRNSLSNFLYSIFYSINCSTSQIVESVLMIIQKSGIKYFYSKQCINDNPKIINLEKITCMCHTIGIPPESFWWHCWHQILYARQQTSQPLQLESMAQASNHSHISGVASYKQRTAGEPCLVPLGNPYFSFEMQGWGVETYKYI